MPEQPNSTPSVSDAATAALGERVSNITRRQTDLENEMRAGFRSIESHVDRVATDTRAAIASLTQNLSERNKPQWQAIGVALTFAVVIGGMAYWPIREATVRLETASARLEERMVTRQEMDWRQARSAEDRSRMEGNIVDIRDGLVPRREHERVWANFDQRFLDQQRQLDEVKAQQNSVYGARDVLIDLRERLDRLEQQRRMTPPPL